ncbi:MAG: hypothetical protein ACM3VW_07375 [Bacteroidota bacterium]
MPELKNGRWYLAPGDEVRVGKREFAEGEEEDYDHPVVADDGSIPGAAVEDDGPLVEFFSPHCDDFFITERDFDVPQSDPGFGRRFISDTDEYLAAVRQASELAGSPSPLPESDEDLDEWLKEDPDCRATYQENNDADS